MTTTKTTGPAFSTHPLIFREDARFRLDRLMDGLLSARRELAERLEAYEATGDHDHGRGPIAPGGTCPGGDCTVARTRAVLAQLTDALSDAAQKEFR